jgi:hypothetical protein
MLVPNGTATASYIGTLYNTSLTYQPNTGVLSATTFSGAFAPTNLTVSGISTFGGLQQVSYSIPTLASATTIAPSTNILFVSGTNTITTITKPFSSGNSGQITIIPTGIFTTNNTINIALASTAVVSKALIMTYCDITSKWYPSY